MSANLFFVLAAVYLISIAGIVVVSGLMGSEPTGALGDLDRRLALVRSTPDNESGPRPATTAQDATAAYFVQGAREHG